MTPCHECPAMGFSKIIRILVKGYFFPFIMSNTLPLTPLPSQWPPSGQQHCGMMVHQKLDGWRGLVFSNAFIGCIIFLHFLLAFVQKTSSLGGFAPTIVAVIPTQTNNGSPTDHLPVVPPPPKGRRASGRLPSSAPKAQCSAVEGTTKPYGTEERQTAINAPIILGGNRPY